MAIEPERLGELASDLMADMGKYGPDAEVTAMVAVATVKTGDGHVYIQYRAADGDGDALPTWHVNGILRYVLSYSEAKTPTSDLPVV